jgi:hypothetical protein
MHLLPVRRRTRVALAVTVTALVAGATWGNWYRPWEAHYEGRPASWWARQYPSWKLTSQSFVFSGKPVYFWLPDPGPPPKPFWFDWVTAIGIKADLTDPTRLTLLRGDPDAVPVLRALLYNPLASVRQVAVYGLKMVGRRSPDAVDALVAVVAASDQGKDEFWLARSALLEIGPDAAARAGIEEERGNDGDAKTPDF